MPTITKRSTHSQSALKRVLDEYFLNEDEKKTILDKLKNKQSWTFRHMESEAPRVLLYAEPDKPAPNGGTITGRNITLKFTDHIAYTTDTQTALWTFLSDAYRKGEIKLLEEYEYEENEKMHQEYLELVKKDPARFERLKEELSSDLSA